MEKSLEFRNIEKLFPGVRALGGVNFTARGGRVTAILGENGAGKSTLLKVMNGDLKPDSGALYINGVEQHFESPDDAIKAGISVIYQERQLFPLLSVAENLFPGQLPKTKLGLFDKKKLMADAQAIIDKFGLKIDPRDMVGMLPVAYQQMVEIMKAYRRDSDVVAFDESTAPLTDSEIAILFDYIRELKAAGKVVLYVSHRMNELFEICDDVVVMKDGQYVKSFEVANCTEADLIKAMVGRDIGDTYSNLKRNDKFGEVLLELKDVRTLAIRDVSFQVRAGEIIGLAGLVGAGRTETARAIFGADPLLGGEVWLEGNKLTLRSPKDAIDAGIFLCPEDRQMQGLVMWRSIKENIAMPSIDKLSKGIFVDYKAVEDLADEAVAAFDIKTPDNDKIVGQLSGGNQQKVILGRWINSKVNTKVLILDEPTKGIDVGTKAEIYKLICDLACRGMAVILISSELPEVINLADRIIVMHNGHITGTVDRADATEESVLRLAMLD
ncbi:MAG: sugar ABC transporter ATP-binding protein [Oscillospiraceae bacterium]|nr:sugar ABC transporter ATP-binding protein [Oscillospiraceae bacterium]